MSERLRVTNNPVSNEEIIKELTEQFDIFPKDDQTQTQTKDISEGIIVTENKAEAEDSSIASNRSKLKKPEKNELEDFDDDQDDDGKNYDSDSDSTDSIDEVALKDQEVVLTEEERVQRKEKAEELKKIGNQAFGDAEFRTSKCKYTEALKICPLECSQQRAVLYCNRSAAKIHLEMYAEAIKDATKAIELDDKYIKAYHRRATSYERTDKLDECLADYKRILELDPHEAVATKALERLPPLIEARNEKLKTEMMGKLKDLGNMILKPFGLSTDNFQMEQDPETKGYKINFKQ